VKVSLIREMKYLCEDFTPIRETLIKIGASVDCKKIQEDYIYHLIDENTGQKTKRLKLRIENNIPKCVYIYNRCADETTIQYDYFELNDFIVKDILNCLFNVTVIVRKQREVWRKDNIIFNLDIVEEIGNIFEIEIENGNKQQYDIEKYKSLFISYLSKPVLGSNEDIILNKNYKTYKHIY
jgi:adenylate cyclase class IV